MYSSVLFKASSSRHRQLKSTSKFRKVSNNNVLTPKKNTNTYNTYKIDRSRN